MALDALLRDQLSLRFGALLPFLDERQKRLALGTEARLIGHGGVRAVAVAAGVSEATVRSGVAELETADSSLPVGRSRRCGGRRSRCGTWPTRCPGPGIRSPPRRSAGC